jgi:hypothetical protein
MEEEIGLQERREEEKRGRRRERDSQTYVPNFTAPTSKRASTSACRDVIVSKSKEPQRKEKRNEKRREKREERREERKKTFGDRALKTATWHLLYNSPKHAITHIPDMANC